MYLCMHAYMYVVCVVHCSVLTISPMDYTNVFLYFNVISNCLKLLAFVQIYFVLVLCSSHTFTFIYSHNRSRGRIHIHIHYTILFGFCVRNFPKHISTLMDFMRCVCACMCAKAFNFNVAKIN